MSSICLDDACALASKIELEFDKLIQPSASDKALIILYRALLEEQRKVKCSVLCHCEDPYSASRKQAAMECVEILGGFPFEGRHAVALMIAKYFGLEI